MKSLNVLAGALGVLALVIVTPVRAQDRPQGGGGGGVHSGGGGMGAAGGGGTNGPAGMSGTSGMSGGASSGGFSGGGSSAGGFSGSNSGSGGSSVGSSSYSGPSPMGGGMRSAVADRGGRPAAGGAALRSGLSRSAASADPNNAAVPGGSRPNYGNTSKGTAVTRGSANTGGGGTGVDYYSPYDSASLYSWYYGGIGSYQWGLPYWTVGYGCPWGSPADCYRSRYYSFSNLLYGYGAYGLGSFYYDPAWWGTGLTGYGADASNYPMLMDEAGGGLGGGGWSDEEETAGPKGGLKLKVEPKIAEVYVDGYYMGLVNDYDGPFQRLNLPVGRHHLEIRATGYQPLGFDVNIEARDTISFHGDMQPVK